MSLVFISDDDDDGDGNDGRCGAFCLFRVLLFLLCIYGLPSIATPASIALPACHRAIHTSLNSVLYSRFTGREAEPLRS